MRAATTLLRHPNVDQPELKIKARSDTPLLGQRWRGEPSTRPIAAFFHLFNFLCIAQSVQKVRLLAAGPRVHDDVAKAHFLCGSKGRRAVVWKPNGIDGTIEPIDKFKAHYEALHWVRTHCGVDRGAYSDEPGCGIPMRKGRPKPSSRSRNHESPGPNWIVDRKRVLNNI